MSCQLKDSLVYLNKREKEFLLRILNIALSEAVIDPMKTAMMIIDIREKLEDVGCLELEETK